MAGSPVNVLMVALAEIALSATHGCSAEAARLTKRAWDAERTRLGRDDVPRAESIRQRLGVSWVVALDIALGEAGGRLRLLGLAGKSRFAESSLTVEEVLNGLRGAARRLGTYPTISSYEAHRAWFNARSSARRADGVRLPCVETIAKRFGSFPAALDQAGIVAAAGVAGPPRPEKAPPMIDTLDQFVTEESFLPRRDYFLRWAAARGIAVGRERGAWTATIDALRQRRSERGDPTPARALPTSQAPPLPPPNRRKNHRRQDAVASVALWAKEHLRPGDPPKWRAYLEASRVDPRLLAVSIINRHGPFAGLCAEAGL